MPALTHTHSACHGGIAGSGKGDVRNGSPALESCSAEEATEVVNILEDFQEVCEEVKETEKFPVRQSVFTLRVICV